MRILRNRNAQLANVALGPLLLSTLAVGLVGGVQVGSATASARYQETEQQRTIRFGAAVDLVLIGLMATDSGGTFVQGLTKEDFRLFEEGEEMEISFFALEKFASSESKSGDPLVNEMPSLSRYIVLFIDGMNTLPQDWQRVRPLLQKWVEEDLQSNDYVLLASLHPDGRVRMTREFTRDRETLVSALAQVEGNSFLALRTLRQQEDLGDVLGLEATIPNSGGASADALRQGAELARTFANERRREVRGALRSLSGLADHLNLTFQVPGPNVVIMVSGGLPEIPGLNFALMVEEQLDETSLVVRQRAGIPTYQPTVPAGIDDADRRDLLNAIGRFNSSNYLFYTIDARGVGGPRNSSLSPNAEAFAASNERSGLISIADGTGGLAFFNSNNFGLALTRVQEDTAYRYVLGYVAPLHDAEDIEDGKVYEVEVEVRVPGVEIRARKGYVDRGG